MMNKLILYISTFFLFIVALYDVTGRVWHTQFDAYKLPKNEIYTYLETFPKGLVCEVPFYSSKNDVPESSYIYTYNRSIYKAPLLNAQVQPSSKYYDAFNALSLLMKHPDNEIINILREIGVRYIVVENKISEWNSKDLKNELTLLKKNKEKSLYQIDRFFILKAEDTRSVLIQKTKELEQMALKIQMKSAPLLKVEELINFKSSDSQKFLISGFSSVEDWGTWTDGNKAIIAFRADDELINRGKYMQLLFNIFSDGKHTQNIKLILNGEVVDEDNYLNVSNYILSIPLGNKLKKENLLVIEASNAISPKELNINADARKLSIGLISIKVDY